MANNLLLKLIIAGSNTGAIQALAGVQAEARKTGTALSRMDVAGGGFAGVRSGLSGVEGQLRSVQALAGQVFAFAGISVGFAAIIQLADAYSNMTGRLRLATQYTGDFTEVMGMLQQSARDTRSDLQGTVDLYVKMAPALQGIGLSAEKSVGVITTINQAIGLSGASAQAAAAALMQLGQGFGSGVLRGEELNSILEQTPALAQAIADGLGRRIGDLRALGEEGKLTAEVVAGALQKMAPQLEADFAALPKTVSQALTELRNEFLLFVGATDAATNGTSSLANIISEVAAAFRDGAPPVVAMTETLKILMNGLDGTYRLLKIVGLGLAGYSAAATAALTGDFDGARFIWQQLGKDIDEVLLKPLVTAPKVITASTNVANKRALLEEQLKIQVERLEQAKAFIAGKTSDSVAAKDKENIDKRIADQQRLVDAVRSAWQASLSEAQKATEKQKELLQKAGDYRQRGQDAAFNASLKGMSPEQQARAKANRLEEVASAANFQAARARVAALEGDAKKFETLAAGAEKKLLAALSLAEDVGDAAKAESIAGELAKLADAQAGIEAKKAAAANEQATAQAALLNDLQAKLESLKQAAREIEVQADVDKASAAIAGLQAQLGAIQDKTVTVTVNTVNNGGGAAPAAPDIPTRAYGGPLPGWAPHDRADNMIYRGTPGEWVIQRPAVRYWGRDFIAAINAMRMPKFAFGGELGGSMVSRLRVPSISAPSGRLESPDVFDFGALGKVRVRSLSSTASDVEAVLKRAALQFGRR